MGRWLYGEAVPTGGRGPSGPYYRFATGASYELHTGFVIPVPSTYVFDLSAPWWAVWALPRRRMMRAAGLHDYCRHDPAFSLWIGNLLFMDALRADGIREPLLTAAWLAVRTNTNRKRIA
ncbi:MAG: DUF1353 domain-containing protein [Brevundimonas sp.]